LCYQNKGNKLRLPRIHDKAKQLSINAATRLNAWNLWPSGNKYPDSFHKILRLAAMNGLPDSSPTSTKYISFSPFTIRPSTQWPAKGDLNQRNCIYLLRSRSNNQSEERIVLYPNGTDSLAAIKINLGRNATSCRASLVALSWALEGILSKRILTGKYITILSDDPSLALTLGEMLNCPASLVSKCQHLASELGLRGGIKRITIARCPPLYSPTMNQVRQRLCDSRTSTEEITTSGSCTLETCKEKSKAQLENTVQGYWRETLESAKAKNNPDFLRHPRRIMRTFTKEETKFILNLKRKELRVLTSIFTGRALDARTISGYAQRPEVCRYCGMSESDTMEHWSTFCENPEFVRLQDWLSFAHSAGFAIRALVA
jgi:hypothetical protein